MFKVKIKEDERVVFRAKFDKIDKIDEITSNFKKKYKGGPLDGFGGL